MCGIVGIYYFDKQRSVQAHDLKVMTDRMVHRGPDDDGHFIKQNVGLAMRRLSIIDLAGGHQPISTADGSKTIVFNGEAYNFAENRELLIKKGHTFSTHTDTEVVLHLYDEYGEQCFEHINGMFGFAVWDEREKKLLIARDRIGIKPLYYYRDNEKIVFASEIKSILALADIQAEMDMQGLQAYLKYGFTPAPHTLYRNIYKLPPAHVMTLQGSEINIRPYWKLSYRNKFAGTDDELGEELYELLKSSVKYRMIADVPLGAFLSGGIDSSSIVHIMRDLGSQHTNTYSIGFGEGYAAHNELDEARRFATDYNTNHHEIVVRPDVVDLFPQLIEGLDEPLADSSFIMTYLVSKLARESVTVILSGVGGDELFGGYRRYLNTALDKYVRLLPSSIRKHVLMPILNQLPVDRNGRLPNLTRLAKGYLDVADLPAHQQYASYTSVFDNQFLSQLTRHSGDIPDYHQHYFDECDSDDLLDKLMYFDLKASLPEQLLMLTDKMTMAVSLEARVPYLDHRVVEFAARLPSEMKIRGFKLRHLQKHMFSKRFPDYVLQQKKKGFGAPVGSWMRNDLKEITGDLLSKQTLQRQGIFDASFVEKLFQQHHSQQQDHTDQLLGLLSFQIWYQSHMGQ